MQSPDYERVELENLGILKNIYGKSNLIPGDPARNLRRLGFPGRNLS